jgi:hypothetical protein
VDLGDWQELSRLRFENHVWHRCVDEIHAAVERPGASAESIAQAIEQSVAVLNRQLRTMHRRPVGSGA